MAKVLRDFQNALKRDIYSAWNAGHKNVLAIMPTGTGKTVSFCSIAIDLTSDDAAFVRNLLSFSTGKTPTAILVHRKELVQQISLTLSEEGIRHNIIAPTPTIKGIVAAQRRVIGRQLYDYNACVTVVSVDTLQSRISRHQAWAKSIKLWICDEAAHVLKDNKWGRVLKFFPNALGLGVTATPQRLDKRGLGSHADGVFDIMIEGPTTKWAIKHKYLCDYRFAIPESNYNEFLVAATEGHDYSKEAQRKASQESTIIGDVVREYQKLARGKQTILFASDIVTATDMEKKFIEAGVKAKLLTAETDDKERLQALIDFKDKKIQVLLNVDLFDEGLDVPGIEVVILARKTKSLGKYLQMIGRGLRPIKGKEYLLIIDHVGNVWEHGKPDNSRNWTLDRIVKKRDGTNLIRICSNHPICNMPFERYLTACPYCEMEIPKSKPGEGLGRPSPKQVDGDLVLLDPEMLAQMFAQADLEEPASVASRVSKVAGHAAGLKAMANQVERKKTQQELANVIALWAGKRKREGYADRSIHKLFYLQFDQTITESLSQPRADMLRLMEEVRDLR